MNVHTKTYKGLKIRIEHDEHCRDPYSDRDMFMSIKHWHRRGFIGTDWSGRDAQDIKADIAAITKAGGIVLPLFLYEHGGQTISLSSFSCPWDSGQVGFVIVEGDKVRAEFGRGKSKRITAKARADAMALVKAEVAEVDSWLRGECYGYVIEDSEGEHLDSCWGFIGDRDYCLTEAKSQADYYAKQADIEHAREAEKSRPDMYAA